MIVSAAATLSVSTANADPAADFANCLKNNGVTVQLPKNPPKPPKGAPVPDAKHAPPAPPGVDSATWNAAWSACFKYAPKPPAKR